MKHKSDRVETALVRLNDESSMRKQRVDLRFRNFTTVQMLN